ncbi:MAG: sulfite exporter TauE/SafE family protein [Actinomycetaceae bacterium]|nr:sulfite exporter TauE/SafE family protein [Actinomycetaceae bacterium]
MPGLEVSAIVVLCIAALIVGVSKTALPGAATLAVALTAAVMPGLTSTGMMLLLLITGDVVAIIMYRKKAHWPTLVNLVPGVLAGLVLGAIFLSLASDRVIRVSIGLLLLALIAITTLMNRREEPPRVQGPVGRAVYGTLAGATTMAANAGGPVTSMYFLASRFSINTFIGTTAWFYFLVNLAKLPFSVAVGAVDVEALRIALPLMPLVLVGTLAGKLLASRMPQQVFNPVITALTVVSAVYLLF